MNRRLAVTMATAVGIAGSFLMTAPAAHAATTVTIDNTGSASPRTIGSDSQVKIVNNYRSSVIIKDSALSYGGTDCAAVRCVVTSSSNKTLDIAPGTNNYTVNVYEDNGGFDLQLFSATLNISYGSGSGSGSGSGLSSASSTGDGPALILQEFAVPVTGTCDEAQPEGLNWGGVASGGWSTVWGEWMHDGLGGWACSRTLSYSTAHSKWVVN